MKENSCIIYFLTRSLFLGFGITMLFLQGGKDCYIGSILGFLIGLIFTYGFQSFVKSKNGKNIRDILNQNKIIGTFLRVLLLLISYLLLLYALVIYKTFVTSFLLINTPEIMVLIPIVALASYAAFKSLKVISRVAEALLPFSLIVSLIAFLGVMHLFEFSNFMPIFTLSSKNFLLNVITFAGISSFPNLLTIHFNSEPKGFLKIYTLSSIIIIALIIYVNGIFGEALVHIFRFPEYMVLKQLKLFQFIEKVENVLSIAWICDLFFLVSMSIYSIKELLPQKKPKIVTSILLILTLFGIKNVFAYHYPNELKMFYILPYLSFGVTIIVLLFLLYFRRKNKKAST